MGKLIRDCNLAFSNLSHTNRDTPLIVHVINRFGTNGGAENQLYQNLEHFDHSLLQHAVAHIYGEVSDELSHVPRASLCAEDSGIGRLRIAWRTARLLRALRPDLVHATLAEAALGARLVGLFSRVPVVESLVNISHERVRVVDNPRVTRVKLAGHALLDRVTMRGVHAFQAISRGVGESWSRVVGIDAKRIHYIPRGVHLPVQPAPVDRAAIKRRIEVAANDPLIVNMGRHEAQKGQLYLIEAMSRILASFPTARLVILGRTGNLTTALQQRIDDLGLTSHVIMPGIRDDVQEILSAADVFAFPSLFEGLGVSLLEAMAAGKPVVVTNAVSFDEIIEDRRNGLMVPPQNPEALASAIVELLSDPELAARLAETARADAARSYRIADVASQLEQLYQNILGIHSVVH